MCVCASARALNDLATLLSTGLASVQEMIFISPNGLLMQQGGKDDRNPKIIVGKRRVLSPLSYERGRPTLILEDRDKRVRGN